MADGSLLRKEGRKRPNPVFVAPLPPEVGLAAPGAVLPPSRPKGDEPPVLDVPGLEPPAAGFVPVVRAPPNGDELLEVELPGVAGFLSAVFAPPKRPARPPSKPPDFGALLVLGAAGLSPAFAPPPKRPAIPLRPLVIPPKAPPLLALGVAGLLPACVPPPKRPARPPSTPPDFFSSGLLPPLAGLAGLPPGGAELAAGRLPPNCDDPPEPPPGLPLTGRLPPNRSEERRVGKECA